MNKYNNLYAQAIKVREKIGREKEGREREKRNRDSIKGIMKQEHF